MADDRLDDASESGRPKRPPPTLELSANEMPREAESDSAAHPEPAADNAPRRSGMGAATSAGALAGALVAGLAWFAASTWLTATPEPQPATVTNVNAARLDDLTGRLAKVEARPAPAAPAAPDLSAMTTRLDALDKSAAALREENAALRTQFEKATSAASEARNDGNVAPPDLSGITNRLAQVEAATQSQIAKLAEQVRKPADEISTRRLATASLLDAQVRAGEPFAAALNAAKLLAPDAAKLAPLQPFAATGVPGATALARALLDLPDVTPPPTATSGGLIDRIRSGATKLVKVERLDSANGDNAAFARAAAAARRDDLAAAAKELAALPASERVVVQPWLDRVAARNAALAASRQFADDALAALPKTDTRASQ